MMVTRRVKVLVTMLALLASGMASAPAAAQVNQAPVSIIEPGVESGIAPLLATFDGSGSFDVDGEIVDYSWDFGDGGVATGDQAEHTFVGPGSFNVTLTVTDDLGAAARSSVLISVAGPQPLVWETGQVQGVSDGWQTVTLANVYDAPIVVATVRILDSSQGPVVARVQSAAGNTFQVRVQTTNGTQAGTFDIDYVVVEEGVYNIADHGVTMEAVRTVSRRTAVSGVWVRERRSYGNSYTNPVVVGQVMTANDDAWSVFWASSVLNRRTPPTATSFAAGKHVGEDPNATRIDETLGYLVFEAGSGDIAGVSFEAGLGTDTVRGVGNSSAGYLYDLAGGARTSGVLSAAALDGFDGGWPVLFGESPFAGGQLNLAYEEDVAGDVERRHTTEQVAYVVFD